MPNTYNVINWRSCVNKNNSIKQAFMKCEAFSNTVSVIPLSFISKIQNEKRNSYIDLENAPGVLSRKLDKMLLSSHKWVADTLCVIKENAIENSMRQLMMAWLLTVATEALKSFEKHTHAHTFIDKPTKQANKSKYERRFIDTQNAPRT